MSVAGVLTLALLVSTQPRRVGGEGSRRSAATERAGADFGAPRRTVFARSGDPAAVPGRVGPTHAGTCPLADSPTGYRNPLAGASVIAKRIDQGVDYAGSGMLTAIGAARITHLATVDTGWPGAFIEYQLLSGADRGCYVYYAEGITPAVGLHVGENVRAGQAIAAIVAGSSSGIEIGWGAGDGTKSYAAATGEWSATHEANDIPSAAGLYFSALIASLGGPPGQVEG